MIVKGVERGLNPKPRGPPIMYEIELSFFAHDRAKPNQSKKLLENIFFLNLGKRRSFSEKNNKDMIARPDLNLRPVEYDSTALPSEQSYPLPYLFILLFTGNNSPGTNRSSPPRNRGQQQRSPQELGAFLLDELKRNSSRKRSSGSMNLQGSPSSHHKRQRRF